MAAVRIHGLELIEQALRKYGRKAYPVIRKALAGTATLYVTEMRSKAFSGPTSSKTVASRTGSLRRGIRFGGVTEDERGYVAKVTSDRKYALTHFGPRGRVTVIRPKRSKYLAIPLAAAMTSAGVAKGSPRNGPWGDTVVIPTKRGGKAAAIIYGVRTKQSGKNAGKGFGGLVPLFALVKQVKIVARVDPRDFIEFIRRTYVGTLKQGMKGLKNG